VQQSRLQGIKNPISNVSNFNQKKKEDTPKKKKKHKKLSPELNLSQEIINLGITKVTNLKSWGWTSIQ
jgi:hypothetical protein